MLVLPNDGSHHVFTKGDDNLCCTANDAIVNLSRVLSSAIKKWVTFKNTHPLMALFHPLLVTSRVPVERKSSVCDVLEI